MQDLFITVWSFSKNNIVYVVLRKGVAACSLCCPEAVYKKRYPLQSPLTFIVFATDPSAACRSSAGPLPGQRRKLHSFSLPPFLYTSMTGCRLLRTAAVACCAFSLVMSTQADNQMAFTAYRPLQYEAAPGFQLGPWGRVSLSGAPVSTCERLLGAPPSSRRILCISKATALSADEVEKLLDSNHFLLLLLPPSSVQIKSSEINKIKEIERMLLDRRSSAAVAFARETTDLEVLVGRLNQDEEYEKGSSQARSLRPFLTAHSPYKQEWKPAQITKGVTLTSWLRGKSGADGAFPPTLIFVAHHDAFASVPHFASGVSSSASGAIGLMWLARELRKLYKQNEMEYSIAFVLADASALNYEGIAHWIGQADPRLLNATRYVLCLDNLASASLTLHTPKAYKDPEAARFLRAIENTLSEEGVRLSTRTRKIAVGEKLLPFWPHEHFTRAKLIAGSLSAEAELKHLWNRSSVADNRLDEDAMAKTMQGLAEGIARFLLNVEQTKTRLTNRGNADHLDVFIASWAKFSAETPRFFAYRGNPLYVGSPFASNRFINSVSDELESVGLSLQRDEFVVDMGGFSFSYETPMTIQVAEARPAFFDWLLLLGAIAYSFALFLAIKGINKSGILSASPFSFCFTSCESHAAAGEAS